MGREGREGRAGRGAERQRERPRPRAPRPPFPPRSLSLPPSLSLAADTPLSRDRVRSPYSCCPLRCAPAPSATQAATEAASCTAAAALSNRASMAKAALSAADQPSAPESGISRDPSSCWRGSNQRQRQRERERHSRTGLASVSQPGHWPIERGVRTHTHIQVRQRWVERENERERPISSADSSVRVLWVPHQQCGSRIRAQPVVAVVVVTVAAVHQERASRQ